MRVLVACEESQAVTIEFRKLGHEAYSCDLLPCSGGHPEWHLQQDVTELLKEKWDMIIAFPPCTYLSNAGARWLYQGGKLNQDRYKKGLQAKKFLLSFLESDCPRVVVENPISSKVYDIPPYTQEIQPYQFGDPYSKRTRLWIKGLPELKPTNILKEYRTFMPSNTGGVKRGQHHLAGIPRNKIESSKTFPGIAKAMAEQWGKYY
jgi:hypothetical protein